MVVGVGGDYMMTQPPFSSLPDGDFFSISPNARSNTFAGKKKKTCQHLLIMSNDLTTPMRRMIKG